MKKLLFILILLSACKGNDPTPATVHNSGRLAATELAGTTWRKLYTTVPRAKRFDKVLRFEKTEVYFGYVINTKKIYFPRNSAAYTFDGSSVYIGTAIGQVYGDSLVLDGETFVRE